MKIQTAPASSNHEIQQKNHRFYDDLWGRARLLQAENFNTWPLVSTLLSSYPRRLEVAPGLRPRLPVKETTFVDISKAALSTLNQHGGHSTQASICQLPFPDQSFDMICALDIIEHVSDDEAAFRELSRVASEGAVLLLSTPLHPLYWTPFDECVGHYRRYEPQRLLALLEKNHFVVQQSDVFGMKPRSSFLTNLGMWFLKHRPRQAMWWYNRILPFTAKRQKPLALQEGLLPLENIGEIFLLCRRQRSLSS